MGRLMGYVGCHLGACSSASVCAEVRIARERVNEECEDIALDDCGFASDFSLYRWIEVIYDCEVHVTCYICTTGQCHETLGSRHWTWIIASVVFLSLLCQPALEYCQELDLLMPEDLMMRLSFSAVGYNISNDYVVSNSDLWELPHSLSMLT